MVQLDDLDREILRLLKEDARMTISEIAEKLGRPESTVHFRIKKLQEKGVIERYTIVLGRELRPKSLAIVYIQAEMPIIEDFLERYIQHIIKTLSLLPSVLAVARSSYDSVVVIIGEENNEKLKKFIDDTIRVLPGLRNVEVISIERFHKGRDLPGFLVQV